LMNSLSNRMPKSCQ